MSWLLDAHGSRWSLRISCAGLATYYSTRGCLVTLCCFPFLGGWFLYQL
jgi:hypothetical protein